MPEDRGSNPAIVLLLTNFPTKVAQNNNWSNQRVKSFDHHSIGKAYKFKIFATAHLR